MTRHRLRADAPLIRRSGRTVQVGDTGLLLRALTSDEMTWLASLDGLSTDAELLETAPSDRAGELLQALRDVGALIDNDALDNHFRMLAPAERMLLLPEYDVLALSYQSATASTKIMSDRGRLRVSVIGDGEVAATMRMSLRACGYHVSDQAAGFVVLADRGHPDVVDDHGLVQADIPHLPIHTSSGRAHIGPLVLPGVSSCLRCADQHRTDADPEWPSVATQLAVLYRNRESANPTLIHLAVGQALAVITQWTDAVSLERDVSPFINTSVYLASPGGRHLRVERPPHPLCGCRWEQPGCAQTG